jgi:hypothetical protein
MSNWLSHSSILGHIGGYVDRALNPISWATHGKWTHLTSDVLPEKVNSGLSAVMRPFDKIDQTINPVRKIPIVNRLGNIVAAKPGDALAIAAGAVFGGAAALGGGAAGGGAGGAGAAGGSAAAGGGVADVGGLAALDSGAVAAEGAAPELMAGGGGAVAGGAGAAGGSTADVGGLAAQDSAAVDAEGAEPGLTQGYGPAQSSTASSQFQQGGQQQQQEDPRKKQLQQLAIIQQPTLEQREAALMVDSSRALKTSPGPVSMRDIVHAGASGADQITENGVHIGAIRALHTKIANLEAIAKQRGITV